MQDTTPKVTVSRKGEDRIAAGHPWIFASDVTNRGAAQPGDAVHVVNTHGRTLGTAHYSSTSQITLRLLSRKAESIDRAFFLNRFHRAAEHRERVVRDSDAYRLVHAEGDLLPGLIVDRYGDCLAVQFLDQGMDRAGADIVSALDDLLQPRSIVAKNDVAVRKHESLPLETKVLWESLPAASNSTSTGCAGGSIPWPGRRQASTSTNARTTRQPGASPGVEPWIVSPRQAGSRCTSPVVATTWKRSIPAPRRWSWPGPTEL